MIYKVCTKNQQFYFRMTDRTNWKESITFISEVVEDLLVYLFISRNRILLLSITEHKSIRRFYFPVNWANEKSRVSFIFRSRAFDDCQAFTSGVPHLFLEEFEGTWWWHATRVISLRFIAFLWYVVMEKHTWLNTNIITCRSNTWNEDSFY